MKPNYKVPRPEWSSICMDKKKIRNLPAAALVLVFLTVTTAGCYVLTVDYSLGVGIVLLTAGLTGTLAICVSSVAQESSPKRYTN